MMTMLLLAVMGSVFSQTTYTFTSKSWAADNGNWTSGKDGNQLTSGRGVQVTTGSSEANATSPVSFNNVSYVEVTYSTNANAGAGTIVIQVGNNLAKSYTITKTGGTSDRTAVFDYETTESGKVKITVNCTTNSIYIKSIAITTSSSSKADPNLEFSETNVSATIGETFTPPTLSYANEYDGTITYASSNSAISVDENSGAVSFDESAAGESATITATATETNNYKSGTASYVLTVVDPNSILGNLNNATFGTSYEGSITGFTSATGTIGTVTVTYSRGNAQNAYINDSQIRLYKGSTLSFSVPEGYYIKSLTFNNTLNDCSADIGSVSGKNWNAPDNQYVSSVTLTRGGSSNLQLSTVYISFGQLSGYVATPTFSPEEGTYYDTQNVTITCATDEATIYFTTDGTDPSTSSSEYTSAIPVLATTTIKAIAVKSGMNNSPVATATYTILIPIDPTVSFANDPASVRVGNTFTNTINKPSDLDVTYSVTSGSEYVTIDATTGEVTGVAEGQATIKASWDAVEHTYNAGSVSYVINVISASGTMVTYEKITSTDDLTDGNYLIVYEEGSIAFDGSLSTLDVSGNTAEVVINDNRIETDEDIYFTIDVAQNTIKSASGNYIGKTSDSNGMDVSATEAYTHTFGFYNGDANIIGSGGAYLRYNSDSNSKRFRYYKSSTYTGQKAIQLYKEVTMPMPIITPGTGEYTEDQTVTITSSIEGATIYYTTDATTPTTSSAVYSEPFTVSETTTIMAIAVKDGKTSSVATATLTFVLTPPVISPESIEQGGAFQVTITAARGTIYYIEQTKMIYLDLETGYPTETNTGVLNPAAVAYSGALTYSQPMMVTAVAVDANGNISDATTAIYTYTGTVTPPYYETFSDYSGGFTSEKETNGPEWKIKSNTGPEAIARWGEERHYEYVSGTNANTYAYNITRYYGTADLISPIIDLTEVADPSFFFIHAGHGFYSDPNTTATHNTGLETTLNDAVAQVSCKVYVGISDASGNVSAWTQIPWGEGGATFFTQKFLANGYTNEDCTVTSSTDSRGGQFNRVNSGEISLDEYVGSYIRIKFEYTSDNEHYGTWNVDKFQVNASKTEKIDMNSKGWTTHVIDHDIDAYQTTQNYGGDLEIFKVTEFDHSTAVLQQLGFVENHDASMDDSERYLPARTPIVVHGPADNDINLVIYQSPEKLPQVKNNLLHGSLAPNLTTPTGNVRYFILQMKEGEILPYFNRLKEGRSVPDHKAYLNGEQQSEAITSRTNAAKGLFVMRDLENEDTYVSEDGGFVDGIQDVSEETMNAEWYTISGVRVVHPSKGIYIMNGKKVIIK